LIEGFEIIEPANVENKNTLIPRGIYAKNERIRNAVTMITI